MSCLRDQPPGRAATALCSSVTVRSVDSAESTAAVRFILRLFMLVLRLPMLPNPSKSPPHPDMPALFHRAPPPRSYVPRDSGHSSQWVTAPLCLSIAGEVRLVGRD